MDKLSTKAIEIINELHTERLDYYSEYLPLIDSANRLAELEDKIESGQFIELPCKIGDTLYVPWVYDDQADIMKLTVDEITINIKGIIFSCSDFETDALEFKTEYNNGKFNTQDFNIVWFTDKLQAEAKLKELKENK